MSEWGSVASPVPGRHARDLDPDRPVWERQAQETDEAYKAFQAYLESERRKVTEHGPNALRWSSHWSWGFRAFEFDKHVSAVEMQDLIRYRVKMNQRHRRLASAVQAQVVEALQGFNPAHLKPADLVRWLEVSVRIERLASGDDRPLVLTPAEISPADEVKEDAESIASLVARSGLDPDTVASALMEALRSSSG